MKLPPDYLRRIGYRLLTEAEWEFACRAEAKTSRYYGNPAELLGHYAWYVTNAPNWTRPVGMLKPNDFGFFDMLGNASEWVNSLRDQYPQFPTLRAVQDVEGIGFDTDLRRLYRGGSVYQPARFVRSAFRTESSSPISRHSELGFRVARTHR